LFAQAGLKVPAEEYKCPVFNNFFSHFPKDEDEDLNFGKLAEELTRIKKAMPMITDNALVLFNESFATTTETEGFEIASDILRAVHEYETPPKILFVTHSYQLLKKRHEVSKMLSHGTKIKSLIVSEGKSATDRTYKIIEGEPQENINTIGFFDYLTKM
jgi:DNA mismatch repair ATPase MutS